MAGFVRDTSHPQRNWKGGYNMDVTIMCNDGKEYYVTYSAGNFAEYVNRRIFECSFAEAQYILLALNRGTVYALEHGLACPADFKWAMNKIKSFKTY